MGLVKKEVIERVRNKLRKENPNMSEDEFNKRFKSAVVQYEMQFEKGLEKVFGEHIFRKMVNGCAED